MNEAPVWQRPRHQLIADRMAQKREIVYKTLLTYHNSAYTHMNEAPQCRVKKIQPTADRVAQNRETISKTLSTYLDSAHGIYDYYHVMTWY